MFTAISTLLISFFLYVFLLYYYYFFHYYFLLLLPTFIHKYLYFLFFVLQEYHFKYHYFHSNTEYECFTDHLWLTLLKVQQAETPHKNVTCASISCR